MSFAGVSLEAKWASSVAGLLTTEKTRAIGLGSSVGRGQGGATHRVGRTSDRLLLHCTVLRMFTLPAGGQLRRQPWRLARAGEPAWTGSQGLFKAARYGAPRARVQVKRLAPWTGCACANHRAPCRLHRQARRLDLASPNLQSPGVTRYATIVRGRRSSKVRSAACCSRLMARISRRQQRAPSGELFGRTPCRSAGNSRADRRSAVRPASKQARQATRTDEQADELDSAIEPLLGPNTIAVPTVRPKVEQQQQRQQISVQLLAS